MSRITLLIPEDKSPPTKVLDKNLNKLESYRAGYKFYFEQFDYVDLHKALDEILNRTDCFMVIGDLTEYAIGLMDAEKSGVRRKKGEKPTIKDSVNDIIVLDLDDHIIKGFDPLNPEKGIKKWLTKRNIKCDVTWQITSSQKLETEEARIRLYFKSKAPHDLEYKKAWAQHHDIQADGCVYTCSQPIYTAPPIIKGGKDPISVRHGFIKGIRRTYKLPVLSKTNLAKYSQSSFEISDWEFKGNNLPDEVLSGRVYRRYFMPKAFHYANKGLDRDDIFQLIKIQAIQVKNREFNDENTYQYIDDALDQIKTEKKVEQDNRSASAEELSVGVKEEIPKFPTNTMEDWPEPWPMIWENFSRIPRECTEELLLPTILSINAFMLRSNFVNLWNRRPNMFFLNLTPSTGNKDVNSKNVIEDLDLLFKEKGKLKVSPFTNIMNSESSITADISFLQSFDADENLFWVNTEATRIFHQLSGGSNSSVSGLADKLIEVVDGRTISGKKKVREGIKSIEDPCCCILFYAQPETIERYITADTIDSGLFGRAMLSILPNLDFDIDNFKLFDTDGIHSREIDEDFYNFYMSNEMMFSKTDHKTVLKPDKKSYKILDLWVEQNVAPYAAEDETLLKVLKRMGIAAEQLYTIVLGVCQAYDKYNGVEPRKKVDVTPLLGLLDYWTQSKIYAIKNFVNNSLDPMADEIHIIVKECLEGKHNKQFRSADLKMLKEENLISLSVFSNIIRNRPALVRKLDSKNHNKSNAVQNALRLIEIMIRYGILNKKEYGSKTFIGIPR